MDDTKPAPEEQPAPEATTAPPEPAPEPEPEAEPEEITVSIGEEPPPKPEPAPAWVKELRAHNRKILEEKRELERRLAAVEATRSGAQPLGPKPTLEAHDYDADKFEAALATWWERKRQVEAEAAARQQAEQQTQQAWQARLADYGKRKTELRVADFEDAEAIIQEALNTTQQGIIVSGAENPALLVYALGKNPSKARELAAITDPVKFAFAIAKLETQLKISRTKTPPPPERPARGSGGVPVSGTVDSHLERLREEAARTGDLSKVMAYKRQKKAS